MTCIEELLIRYKWKSTHYLWFAETYSPTSFWGQVTGGSTYHNSFNTLRSIHHTARELYISENEWTLEKRANEHQTCSFALINHTQTFQLYLHVIMSIHLSILTGATSIYSNLNHTLSKEPEAFLSFFIRPNDTASVIKHIAWHY